MLLIYADYVNYTRLRDWLHKCKYGRLVWLIFSLFSSIFICVDIYPIFVSISSGLYIR